MKKDNLNLKKLVNCKDIIISCFVLLIIFNVLIFILDNLLLSKLTAYFDFAILLLSFCVIIKKFNYKERNINLIVINLLIIIIIISTIALIIGLKVKNIINMKTDHKLLEIKNLLDKDKYNSKSISNNFIMSNFILSIIFLVFNFLAIYINSYKVILILVQKIYLINKYIINLVLKKLFLLLIGFFFYKNITFKKKVELVYNCILKVFVFLFKNNILFRIIKLNTYNKWSVSP
ncbi:hypothetical protein SCORR_v1c07710 [Spiroplasma corruscae]|uniref:Transmembrane protein n=1 Tax=Spiroplasma corruscae TaxID=216934 RepID=A0A222EQL9_9MOLU|nr:hypothetical protein [Spiroplasma corruscae]ASP28543.1 hypothetical protein SCORR_v1c07710 [Spiroplasma corruscae]